MNCRNLEAIITELARDQMLEARNREEALSHMKLCTPCAARFADERALSAGLRTVANEAIANQAASRIEAALVFALRQRATVKLSGPDSRSQLTAPRWSPWAIAAAATILVVSAFAVLEFVASKWGDSLQSKTTARSIPSVPSPTADEVVSPTDPVDQIIAVGPIPDRSQANPRPADRRRSLFREAGFSGRQTPNTSRVESSVSGGEEIATDFLPLTYGSNLSQLDEVQMVRLELPRSVLQSFGLPMNVERAGQRVKADVLLGHDGVARAIRFVK